MCLLYASAARMDRRCWLSGAEGEGGKSTTQTWIPALDIRHRDRAEVWVEEWGHRGDSGSPGEGTIRCSARCARGQACFWKQSKGQPDRTEQGQTPEVLWAQATGLYKGTQGDLSIDVTQWTF